MEPVNDGTKVIAVRVEMVEVGLKAGVAGTEKGSARAGGLEASGMAGVAEAEVGPVAPEGVAGTPIAVEPEVRERVGEEKRGACGEERDVGEEEEVGEEERRLRRRVGCWRGEEGTPAKRSGLAKRGEAPAKRSGMLVRRRAETGAEKKPHRGMELVLANNRRQ